MPQPTVAQWSLTVARNVVGRVPPIRQLRSQRDRLAADLEGARQSSAAADTEIADLRGALAAAAGSASWRPTDGSVAMAFPAGHFYSPIPDLNEIRARAGKIFAVPEAVAGIDLDGDGQLARLPEFGRYYAEQPFAAGPVDGLRYHFDNPFFGFGDGLVYYCMLRSLRPERIIEIGSGWSSALALDVDELFLGRSTEMTFVEPYPERLNELLRLGDRDRVEIFDQPLYEVDSSLFERLSAGDILFIDSTHVSKIGSDVNQLMLEILPALPAGVHVHVHDIFYPFEYPAEWVFQGRAWNENYLLRAYLTNNDHIRITWFSGFLAQVHRSEVAAALPLWDRDTGGSIWFRTV